MNIVIIGNGISGISCARFIRKLSNHTITIISSESKYFFSRTALMYVYMGHMKWPDIEPYESWFWNKNRIELIQDTVETVDFKNKTLQLSDKASISYDKLVIATGSKSNKFGWPGQDLQGVSGLYSKQDLDIIEKHSKDLERAVIVGGGLIGIELAEMFHSRHIAVSLSVREPGYWSNILPQEESEMINRHILEHGIDLKLSTEIKQIHGDNNNRVKEVSFTNGTKLECGFVGLTAGVSPNIDFLKNTELEINKGILVDDYLQSNIIDVYAIGDCAEIRNPKPGRKSIEAIWYTGRMMGETLAHTFCIKPTTYDPGIWFNSAKFFDIEYQIYGYVPSKLEGVETVFWKHPDQNKSIRLIYHPKTKAILGFNLMGVRYRQEVCLKWIAEKTQVEKVLSDLSLANFDPEFFDCYEQELVNVYNKMNGTKIILNKNKNTDSALRFINSKA